MPVDQPNPTFIWVEGVISEIVNLPERENRGKYIMQVSHDELRAILARRLWELPRLFAEQSEAAIAENRAHLPTPGQPPQHP